MGMGFRGHLGAELHKCVSVHKLRVVFVVIHENVGKNHISIFKSQQKQHAQSL